MPIEFNKKPGIVAYLTAGDPDLATTREIALAAIDNGADVIELGVPFSDPLADGPVIQRASERAVARGVRLTDVLELARQLRAARPACGIVIFSYLNPVVRMGMKPFCAAAVDAGADGVLLTDMIVEEADEYMAEMRANRLAPGHRRGITRLCLCNLSRRNHGHAAEGCGRCFGASGAVAQVH